MPEWNDFGIILSAKKYGEKGVIINILTESHGRYVGWINNYKTKSILLFFDYDSHKLSITEKEKLDNFIFTSIKTDSNPIIIYGHTDTKGSKKYNLILSKQRTLSVSKYFKTKGINNKLITKNYGEDYPLIKTGDNVLEKKNRRVEVIINY